MSTTTNTPAKLRAAERWKQRNPERMKIIGRVHDLVYKAVRDGRLTRPAACEQCGAACKPEAAHADYEQPLLVRWLCAKCHRAWDRDHPKSL